ncbi:tape measure protein [Rhizobium oryziradicis]|uniref:Tape measure protein N-terminal domain-containing protein n=1 Tax=Rhizobium oryziradicis TaxID=1867956 RepID=A0A1Q8ZRF7_9HYPH|nr:tape measure protein [Rhizobium oryziradicis]OLP44649.1 hypothetical protein BJF95_09120 [Rhizobium oryziradicis]
MAISEERLIAVLEARISEYEKKLAKAFGTTDRQFTKIEHRGKAMEAKLAAIGKGTGDKFSRGLSSALGGLSAVLSVREVAHYADAWTAAKNSLAVAGVTGEQQKVVLDQLFNSAQKNAAPIGALADLYGRAAQSADVLGASQQDLVKFSDTVALGLRVGGTSAEAASGALQQLGQALGSGNVQAEEFNSIMDGTPALAKAAAAGIKEAGGSVAKLKQLVNDGKISSKNLFQGILVGAERLEEMAGNAAQTIQQGVTKIDNAFTRYIGRTDESNSASQRLVTGLNSLADNFDANADAALQLASVIAGALVGRGIGAMLSQVPKLVGTLGTLLTALRTGASLAPALGSALGPLGAIAGLAAGAAFAFGAFSSSVDDATRKLASQARSGEAVKGMIDDTKAAQDAYRKAVADQAGVQSKSTASIVASTKREFDAKKSLLEIELRLQEARLQTLQFDLDTKSSQLKKEIGEQVYTRNSSVQQGYSDPKIGDFVRLPDSISGLEKTQAAIDANPLTDEIKRIRAESDLAAIGVDGLKKALTTTFADGLGGGAVDGAVSADGTGGKNKGASGGKRTADDRFSEDIQAVKDRTAALVQEQQILGQTYYEQERRRLALDLEQQALKDVREEARQKGDADWQNAKLTPDHIAKIEAASAAYAKQADVLRTVEEAQQRAESSAQEFYGTAKSGFVDVIKGTSSFSDALSNLANKLSDLALNSVFDSIFGGSKTTGSGGILSTAFKAIGLKDGGDVEPAGLIRGPGGPRGDKIPTMLSDGEYVVNAAATKRNRALLEAINNRKHYQHRANGGIVSNRSGVLSQPPRTLDVAQVAASRTSPVQVNFNPVIDNRGASLEAVARNEQALAHLQKTLPAQVVNAIRDARARGVKI